MPLKKFGDMKGIISGGSGTDTDTEHRRATAPSNPTSGKESYQVKHGPGRKISETARAFQPKAQPQASPRRSTRSTSKARGTAPTTASEPPPPLPTSTMSPNKSPGKRGRAPVPQPTTTRRVTRSQSPTKPRIIADSPPPEDRMNPFPPKRAPMTVSDKPAVYNRYGEKVPAPVDIAQKLRQAENFLSDEGPENCADFEDKLIRLDSWLEKHHTLADNVSPDGDQEAEELYRKVKWMIWVHKERLAEGAEQWFTRNQFPDSKSMIKPIKPRKEDQWRVTPDGVATSVPLHPKLQVMLAQDRERIPKERAERAKAVAAAKEAAKARSSQTAAEKASTALENDSEAESEDEKLPSLPYPEVWHRKEAPRFPYGETPHMEQVMSNQISADLARGREAKEAMQGGYLRPLWKAIGNIWPFAPQEDTSAPFDPWALPEISLDEVLKADVEKFNYLGLRVSTVPASPATKRKAQAALNKSPAKRYRPGI